MRKIVNSELTKEVNLISNPIFTFFRKVILPGFIWMDDGFMIKFAGFMGNRKGKTPHLFSMLLIFLSLLCMTAVRTIDACKVSSITEKSGSDASFPQHSEIKNVSIEAVVPLLHLDLGQDLFAIFVPCQLPHPIQIFAPNSFRYNFKYLKTLFTLFISPNAP